MSRYTDEQVEALAEFARSSAAYASLNGPTFLRLKQHGLLTPDGTLADWLRPEDAALRAAREWGESPVPHPPMSPEEYAQALAAIIRKHMGERP